MSKNKISMNRIPRNRISQLLTCWLALIKESTTIGVYVPAYTVGLWLE